MEIVSWSRIVKIRNGYLIDIVFDEKYWNNNVRMKEIDVADDSPRNVCSKEE